ncbi:hypothetical protein QUF75_09825 [Desulfococcaceae bacterium HSG7]|nr:hypothetical protein [Desulfococcaceae bacterium HSG7]
MASTIIIYDDTQNQLPASQPWLIYAGVGEITQTIDSQGVNLVTDDAASAGYSNYIPFVNQLKNPAFTTLDRQIGFQLRFELKLNRESHQNNNRAGFSVILLSDDAIGIELGFWENRIWAQTDTPLFTHGEEADFDTTTAEVLYALTILGNTYTLTADDVFVLGGALRDYSAFDVPYNLPNYLFLGDDTTSAQAEITMGYITITPEVEWADLNGDCVTDLTDAIIALQALTGQNPPQLRTDYVVSGVDVNSNDRVGIEELIYILQKEAELR